MEADTKQLLVHCNDQLYHILKTPTFTFCLICFQDLKTSSEDVWTHINSTKHAESTKCLFKVCNPSLIEDIGDDRFMHIVSKSVFDISVLLGNETCYVSKKNNYWYCLMCEQNITEMNKPDVVLKDHIIEHVLSINHVNKIKGVCFVYKLNTSHNFLLLNKSVVHCSACSDLMQCKEVDLLKTALTHLDSKHPNYCISNSFQPETGSCKKNEELKTTEQGLTDRGISSDYLNSKAVLSTGSTEEPKDESFDALGESLVKTERDVPVHFNVQNQEDVKNPLTKKLCFNGRNICVFLCCKSRAPFDSINGLAIALGKHFKNKHKSIFVETSLEGLVDWVIIHSDCNKINAFPKNKSIKSGLTKSIKRNPQLKPHVKYILKTNRCYFCIVCVVRLAPLIENNSILLEHFNKHFNSLSHQQCLEEKLELNEAFKTNKKSKKKENKTVKKLEVQQERLGIVFQRAKDNKEKKSAHEKQKARANRRKHKKKVRRSKLEGKPGICQD